MEVLSGVAMTRPLHDNGISDGDRRSAEVQVEWVLSQLGLNKDELVDLIDALRWLKKHRAFIEQLQKGSITTLVAMMLAAMASAIWAGIKTLLSGHN